MKIKEFSILEYGPLPERGRISLSDFNLFYGKNESGKTLTIDALIKILTGKDIPQFKNINRVDEKPEGYIIVSDDNGKSIKLKGPKNISNLIELPFNEFNNLFIIRDSDLELYREEDFYNNVTDKLLGLRINDIENILNNLRDLGKLTQTGKFRNIKDEKFDDRINDAEDCIQIIEQLYKKIQNEQFDELEEQLLFYEEKLAKLDEELENYENARKREIYEKGIEALNILKENKKQIEILGVFNEKDRENWRDFEREQKRDFENKERLNAKLDKNKIDLNDLRDQLKDQELEFQIPEKEKKILVEDIKPELKTYEIKRGDIAGQAERSKFFTYVLIISSFLLGICLIGGLIRSLMIWYILASLFAFLTVGSFFYKLLYTKNKAWLEGFIERLNLKLIKIGLAGKEYKEVYFNIQKFENEYDIKKTELDNLRKSKEKLEEKVAELKDERIPEIEAEIEKFEDKILNIKNKSLVKTLQEYEEKLRIKQENETMLFNKKSILNNLFEYTGKSYDESVSHWTSELKNLEKYKEKGMGLKYKEDIINDLKERRAQIEEDLKILIDVMTETKNELIGVERKVNAILNTKEDYLHCTTSNDLEKIRERLKDFLNENYIKRDRIFDTINIFSEIKNEEKQKISKLLSKKSKVADYLKEITNGVYTGVIFEMETGKLKILRKDDQMFEVEKLSGGTYDQLYFAIRIALGEQILQGKTGFFILDDPFIKADSERLKKQIEMLKKICEFGWQVLYFTSKDEIVDCLKEDISSSNVKYIELENLIS